jgi:hypothetical protein
MLWLVYICSRYLIFGNTNCRQEYDVREERRRELEFLEKVQCSRNGVLVVLYIEFASGLFPWLIFTYYCREATHWISNSDM